MNKIKINKKELINRNAAYNIEIELNNKLVDVAIMEDYNLSHDSISVDFEILNPEDVDLTEEEEDLIHEWVNQFKYNVKVD